MDTEGNSIQEPLETQPTDNSDAPQTNKNFSDTIQKGIRKIRFLASNLTITSVFLIIKLFICIWTMIFSLMDSHTFGWFTSSVVIIFDLWHTQRIASKHLAGVKYSCKTTQEGDFNWKFETYPEDENYQKKLFWITLLVNIGYLFICIVVTLSRLSTMWCFLFFLALIANIVQLGLLANCTDVITNAIRRYKKSDDNGLESVQREQENEL
ncbi:hypothetical protein TVAG_336350 [Trichomonas vaginalis G3]|uniref:Golgi apparatus membrane protein TVP23 homolog n=1 Tax=Trichomonas vaginalis (strain ATCC PRA-98 / G3) TaxID=412133 RepID=A2FIN0_TRIV3|nr:eukaryotic protein of unknown function, DUF846 family [Trichomonas vaginalis G3]EAX95240.1 hypothetical protein TVAG_336350 [Trichomonas vaginalis G3]KAI5503484.1 eukaryotic protein of unknown function, DUF846 family [Trichomonas vaginalis G3]|eukprot:XP_001308170.1 hypothetical protein [Trichomonas vaginalis G3]